MDNRTNDIYDLIAKSFSDELTAEEDLQLNSWKSANVSNSLEYEDLKAIWELSNSLIMPKKINLSESLESIHTKADIRKRKVKWLSILQIAAALILGIVLTNILKPLIFSKSRENSEEIVYEEIKSAFGTQSHVTLSDGTEVILNSGSSLKFPASFKNMNTRNVSLIGEGHFVVAKNKKQPFIVNLGNMQVKVLGTTFNINAYKDNSTVAITLVEGKITLQQKSSNGITDLVEMKPNQIATYQNSTNKLLVETEEDLSKYLAWTQGKIVFSNDPIQTVIQKLNNWYNVNIEFTDKRLENYRFTGTFIDEPLEQVLRIINLTSNMNYEIIPAKKSTDNSYSKRKIILTLKSSNEKPKK